jgi:hypothetical protein
MQCRPTGGGIFSIQRRPKLNRKTLRQIKKAVFPEHASTCGLQRSSGWLSPGGFAGS